jgi:hypothetical protein
MSTRLHAVESILANPLQLAREADYSVGYVGLDIPEDVLSADGVFAAHLPWRPGRKTPRADQWLEESFPGWAFSILEDWAEGEFDFMPYVVFSRGDDTSQRLYYYLCELQSRGLVRGPAPLIFDIARIRKPSSQAWTVAAVKRLAGELQLSEAALLAGVETANRRRELMHGLVTDRQAAGSVYERIARASLFAPTESLQLDLAAANPAPRGRILLAGSSPPDGHLHRAVEAAGWTVCEEGCDRNLSRLGPRLHPGGGNVFELIGRHAHASRVGPRAFYDRSAQLLQRARESRADAAIFWLVEEDEALAWDLAQSRQALETAGLPCLSMPRRAWDYSDHPEISIAAFLEGLDP